MLFTPGDRVRVTSGDKEGVLGTVEGSEPDSQPDQLLRWRIALDGGGTWLFLTHEIAHAESE
jgi:hypothetical protein